MPDTVASSCLCGHCGISVTGEPSAVYTCHCGQCQKMTGADYACLALYEPDQVHSFLPNLQPVLVFESASAVCYASSA